MDFLSLSVLFCVVLFLLYAYSSCVLLFLNISIEHFNATFFHFQVLSDEPIRVSDLEVWAPDASSVLALSTDLLYDDAPWLTKQVKRTQNPIHQTTTVVQTRVITAVWKSRCHKSGVALNMQG